MSCCSRKVVDLQNRLPIFDFVMGRWSGGTVRVLPDSFPPESSYARLGMGGLFWRIHYHSHELMHIHLLDLRTNGAWFILKPCPRLHTDLSPSPKWCNVVQFSHYGVEWSIETVLAWRDFKNNRTYVWPMTSIWRYWKKIGSYYVPVPV